MPSRCCIQYVSESGRPSSGHWKDWKRLILIPVPKKGSTKECANHQTSALISYASKVMFKILHARPQHYANQELTDVQAGFRKEWGSRNQNAIIHWIIEKAREFQKNIFLCFIDYTEAFDCVDHDKLWNALTGMGMPEYFTFLMRNLYAVKKQQLEPCME